MQGKLSELVERTAWAAEPAAEPAPGPEPRRLLPLAPRPFSQLARRDYRLYGLALRGYNIALSAEPWYRSGRQRRSVRRDNYPARHLVRSRRIWSARDRDPWEVPDSHLEVA